MSLNDLKTILQQERLRIKNKMTLCFSFPPAGSKNPKVLILGSMPGQVSIAKKQYYAHPQNTFWKIMGDLFGAYPALPYEDRLRILSEYDIALWESLKACNRPGSADTSITEEIPNDFNKFFKINRDVTHIFFDGGKAFQSFKQLILPDLKKENLKLIPLPSTSPRNARMTYAEKLKEWKYIAKVVY